MCWKHAVDVQRGVNGFFDRLNVINKLTGYDRILKLNVNQSFMESMRCQKINWIYLRFLTSKPDSIV